MAYSIKPVLHNFVHKDGTQKINIQVLYQSKKVYAATKFKVAASQFANHEVKGHANAGKINLALKQQGHKIEQRILDALNISSEITKERLALIVAGDQRADEFKKFTERICDELAGKFTADYLRHYTVVAVKVDDFRPGTRLSDMNSEWLRELEAHIRSKGIDSNTVQNNMKTIKAILRKAAEKKMIPVTLFADYKVPKYLQKLPEYLTEAEINAFSYFLKDIAETTHKLAGYYFLLSCYAGYRISDLKRFDYSRSVRDGKITLRAKKNGVIVSIPIYSRLSEVLDYIKDKPLWLSEQKVREYVKELAKLAGIARKVKIHSGRHSFAMLLMEKGFTKDEVAELLGDTLTVSKVYARITNKQIESKIDKLLGS